MHSTSSRPSSGSSPDRGTPRHQAPWWRRPVLRLVGVGVAATGLIVGPSTLTAPVDAAPSPVKIRTIPSKVVAPGSAAVVRPTFTKRSGVTVRKASMDVRRSTSWVGKGMQSARLAPGTYQVTTVVTFRERGKSRVRSARRTQAVRISAAAPSSAPAAPAAPAASAAPVVTSLATQGAPCDSTSLRKPDGSAWTCSFDEEFDGTSLDRSRWTPIETRTSGYQIGRECFVDDPSNISVDGGSLSLTVRRLDAPQPCAGARPGDEQLDHTGGSVILNDEFAQSGGRFEIRAAFPRTTVAGHHGALWMYPRSPTAQWPLSGEIDIAEFYSTYPDRAIPYIHYGNDDASVTNNYCMIPDPTAFNTYTLEWTSTTMSIAYNGVTCVSHQLSDAAKAPFSGDFKTVLTQGLGVYGNTPTSATPDVGTTTIDYVRVWS